MNVMTKVLALFLLTTMPHAHAARLYNDQVGTIRDLDTNLLWQAEDDNTLRTFAQAQSYCNSLSLGGRNNWRLPDLKELMSIVDHRFSSPSINSKLFLGTNTDKVYVSNRPYAPVPGFVWSVWFVLGTSFVSTATAQDHYVRCVTEG